MGTICFDVTEEEAVLIASISVRAMRYNEVHENTDHLSICMDITAAHCNGSRLDLKSLLESGDSDFLYDVIGIMAHLDRRTGMLGDLFIPKYRGGN